MLVNLDGSILVDVLDVDVCSICNSNPSNRIVQLSSRSKASIPDENIGRRRSDLLIASTAASHEDPGSSPNVCATA